MNSVKILIKNELIQRFNGTHPLHLDAVRLNVWYAWITHTCVRALFVYTCKHRTYTYTHTHTHTHIKVAPYQRNKKLLENCEHREAERETSSFVDRVCEAFCVLRVFSTIRAAQRCECTEAGATHTISDLIQKATNKRESERERKPTKNIEKKKYIV